MPLASFVKRNPGRLSHIYAKKHLVVEISVQRDTYLVPWTQFNLCWSIQRQGLRQFAHSLVVRDIAAFQDASGIVDAIVVFLKAQQDLSNLVRHHS
jgi:hypothetical protein